MTKKEIPEICPNKVKSKATGVNLLIRMNEKDSQKAKEFIELLLFFSKEFDYKKFKFETNIMKIIKNQSEMMSSYCEYVLKDIQSISFDDDSNHLLEEMLLLKITFQNATSEFRKITNCIKSVNDSLTKIIYEIESPTCNNVNHLNYLF